MRSALAEDTATPSGGSRRRAAVGAGVVVLLLLAGLAWWRLGDEPYLAPTPDPAGPTVDSAAASQTLHELAEAIASGDQDAAAALGADRTAADLLAAVVANADEVRIEDLGLRYLSESDAPMTTGGWSADVELIWRYGGFDESALRAPVEFGFAEGGSAIASIGGDEESVTPLWLQGRVVSERGGGALVVALGGDRVAAYHREARRAVAVMRASFGGDPRLVVEVPDGLPGLHRAIGASTGTYDTIAAVTTGADGSLVPGTPLHVFVNPIVYDDLDEIAAQVVMTHEAVHVVTGAPFGRSVPLWLLEGFADFIALRDLDLPMSRTAAQVIDQVRNDGVPDHLPDQSDFATASSHLGATYEAAWLVCVVLADEGGADRLHALYDAVVAGDDLDAALERHFGWTEADLLVAWQQRLGELAAGA